MSDVIHNYHVGQLKLRSVTILAGSAWGQVKTR